MEEAGKILDNGSKLTRKHKFDAGQDVHSAEDVFIDPRSSAVISTKLFVAVPTYHVGLLHSRSGLSVKHQLEVGAGIIDVGYTGEVKVHLYNHGDNAYQVRKGDRIAQLITMPININAYTPVASLEDSARGANGFASTGK